MLLDDVAAASVQVAATRSRLAKRAVLVDVLRRAATDGPEVVAIVSRYLGGELRQRRTGLGWRSLAGMPGPADEPSLGVVDVDATFAAMAELSGPGSQTARTEAARRLFAAATEREQRLLARLISGELRQGALDALLLDAVAEATGVPSDVVRRAAMLAGETEVVEVVRTLPARTLVLDGEALALDASGRPRPFQETASRSATRDAELAASATLTPFFFDVLHVDGRDLLDAPLRERLAVLDQVATPHVVQRVVTSDAAVAAEHFRSVVAAGQEGVVVKAADAPYEAGRRGAAWVKVKPRHTLDLVVLAVERGSGRRTGLLSNIHVGAATPRPAGSSCWARPSRA